MRISPEDLRAFAAVIDTGSFVRAAESLHITQSALSRRLQKIEEILGARLLDRTPRSVSLTAVGETFLPIAREAVRGFERSLDEIRDVIEMRSGTVTIASMLSVATNVLPRIVAEFSRERVGVVVRVLDDVGPKSIAMVESGEAEFGIVLEPPDRPRLEYRPLFEDEYVLACRRDHPLARRRFVRWRTLAKHAYIRMGASSGNQQRLARAVDPTLLPAGTIEVQHVSTLLAFIAAGVGISAAPRLALGAASELGIATVRLVEPTVSRPIGIVKLRGRTLSPAAARLREKVEAALTSAPRQRGKAPAAR